MAEKGWGKVREDKGACNLKVVKPLSQYVSFIGTPGAKSFFTPVVVMNTGADADNFSFKLNNLDCQLLSEKELVNGGSQFSNSIGNCTFASGDVDGKLIIESSRCDTAVNVRLSNSKAGYYFGLLKQYKWWALFGISVLFVLIMLFAMLIINLLRR